MSIGARKLRRGFFASGGRGREIRFSAGDDGEGIAGQIHFPVGTVGVLTWSNGTTVINPSGTYSGPAWLGRHRAAHFKGVIPGGVVRFSRIVALYDWVEGPDRYYFLPVAGAYEFLNRVPLWLPRSVTSLEQCFRNNFSFNQDLSGWDTSNVSNMDRMFDGCRSFNQDLSGWCVPLITAKPSRFDSDTTAWIKTGRQPIWGTCP